MHYNVCYSRTTSLTGYAFRFAVDKVVNIRMPALAPRPNARRIANAKVETKFSNLLVSIYSSFEILIVYMTYRILNPSLSFETNVCSSRNMKRSSTTHSAFIVSRHPLPLFPRISVAIPAGNYCIGVMVLQGRRGQAWYETIMPYLAAIASPNFCQQS